MRHLPWVCAVAFACAPTSKTGSVDAGETKPEPIARIRPIPAEPQRPGNPEAGYQALVNEKYVSCGIPYSIYKLGFSPAPPEERLPGRTGRNAELPFHRTALTTPRGVEVVTANCLTCHAGFLQGKLVVGLGNSAADFTTDMSGAARLAGAFLQNPDEKAELQRWADRVEAVAPYSVIDTVGVNTADALVPILFAHRDTETLKWSKTPLVPAPPVEKVPTDVPAWWLMKKKNAMFYVAGGRGDHARLMMSASSLCVEDEEEAKAIDAYFPDVAAYIRSLTAPAYPFTIDRELAGRGKGIFEATCSRCHGTYGTEGHHYPNLLVALEEVGTDPLLAESSSSERMAVYLKRFNDSFYGETARFAPERGYIAPPLDGVWATAPYFHNGSVPTLSAVLESPKRPVYWTRTFDSNDYDSESVGWKHTVLDHGKSGEPNQSKRLKLYDTAQPGYGKGGHTYGDGLNTEDRRAVIEYLKTL